jgi:hypothetical protein
MKATLRDGAVQDRFQAQFWKLRQAEYEPYLLQRSPLRVKQVQASGLPHSTACPAQQHCMSVLLSGCG